MKLPETIPLRPRSSQTDFSVQAHQEHEVHPDLRQLIKKLQDQEKVFPDKKYPSPEKILQRMDTLLDPIISGSLDVIYKTPANIPFVELICHAFFHQTRHNDSEKAGELHTKVVEPLDQLYGVLVAAYISNIMRSMSSDEDLFKNNHKFFEKTAYEIFDEMYKANRRKLEFHILAFDYETKFRNTDTRDDWKDNSRELLCVAYRGKCMRFLSHPACQLYIKTRWRRKDNFKLFEPGNRKYPPKSYENENNYPTTSSPILTTPPLQPDEQINCHTAPCSCHHAHTAEEPSEHSQRQTFIAIWHSLVSPQGKYVIHMTLNILFVVLFAIILIVKPYRAKYSPGENPVPLVWSYMFTYVTLTLTSDLVMQCAKLIFIWNNPRIYWWDFVKMRSLRAIILLCTALYTAIWLLPFIERLPAFAGFLTGLSELVYTAAFVISALSLLKYLSFFEYFGAKIELIKKMASSIVNYILLLIFFWLIYAVVYLSLTEITKSKNETTPWHLFDKGAFEILGEPQSFDRDGDIDGCKHVYWNTINWTRPEEASCLFRSTLLPPALLIYMFVAAVMLINVFTAMLSHEYEKTQERSKNYINFHRYHMLISFESKFLLPAPFNILIFVIWLYKLVVVTINSCCRLKLPIFRRLDPHKWLNTPQGIGPKDVPRLINEARIKELAQKVLERKGKHNFVKTVQDYLNDWESSNPGTDGGIEEAERILQTVIQKFREYLTDQTATARERIVAWEISEMERRSTLVTPAPTIPDLTPIRTRHSSGNPNPRLRAATVGEEEPSRRSMPTFT